MLDDESNEIRMAANDALSTIGLSSSSAVLRLRTLTESRDLSASIAATDAPASIDQTNAENAAAPEFPIYSIT